MLSLSRQQIIAWSAVGLVILLVGANYLRGHLSRPEGEAASVVTVGVKEDRPSRIKVHVTGAVANPGLYEAEAGARVADAIQLAGGPSPAADLNQINLAAKLADGQQVAVPAQGVAAGAVGGLAVGEASAGAMSGAAGGPINLNTATVDQLETLDGVGPKTAQKIASYRDAHGGFQSIEELMEVPGIGPGKFDQIKGQVSI